MRILCLLFSVLLVTGCAASGDEDFPYPTHAMTPRVPDKLEADADGLPSVNVYSISEDTVSVMDVESYVAGVVAGEMKNDWPMEALKAQAILARTFVLKFISEKESRYPGADISTDITEAQAYNADAVNDRILDAVKATEGMVLSTEGGELPYAWFHAHSGGETALAVEGLGWTKAEPAYTRITDGMESDKAPAEAQSWKTVFTKDAFLSACRDTGADPTGLEGLAIAKRGGSGRAMTLTVDGQDVDAAQLRIALGSTVMRSTLLTSLSTDGQRVYMSGKGYGHGVGMPQWGAYALAEDGLSGEDIATYYYEGLSVVQLWGMNEGNDEAGG